AARRAGIAGVRAVASEAVVARGAGRLLVTGRRAAVSAGEITVVAVFAQLFLAVAALDLDELHVEEVAVEFGTAVGAHADLIRTGLGDVVDELRTQRDARVVVEGNARQVVAVDAVALAGRSRTAKLDDRVAGTAAESVVGLGHEDPRLRDVEGIGIERTFREAPLEGSAACYIDRHEKRRRRGAREGRRRGRRCADQREGRHRGEQSRQRNAGCNRRRAGEAAAGWTNGSRLRMCAVHHASVLSAAASRFIPLDKPARIRVGRLPPDFWRVARAATPAAESDRQRRLPGLPVS